MNLTNLLKLISTYCAWPIAKTVSGHPEFASMRRTEDEPLVSIVGTRDNYDGFVTSPEANGSVSCLPTGATRTWKKSGMRLTRW